MDALNFWKKLSNSFLHIQAIIKNKDIKESKEKRKAGVFTTSKRKAKPLLFEFQMLLLKKNYNCAK